MIKSFTAVTREIDDPKAAAAEILAALDLTRNLRRNSLGVVSCFPEFEETGALGAVCAALPFDCVGATTCLCSASGEIDQVMLAVTVLTSDDCTFRTTEIPVAEGYERTIAAGLEGFLGGAKETALLLSYFPLMNTVSGDMILTAIDRATGGIPLFGTSAADGGDSSAAMTIRNGRGFRESVVLAAVCGASRMSFQVASIDENKIRNQRAIITESDGNLLIGVNGKSVLKYLEEIGLTKEEVAAGLGIIPFVVDHKDGTKPVVRAVFALTPDERAVCGGAMPVGATLALGRVDMDDVLRTTESALGSLVERESVVLSYSCMARYFALGACSTAEAETMRDTAGGTPYLFAYSGGEICPLPDADGTLKNFFHNYTNVFCRLS